MQTSNSDFINLFATLCTTYVFKYLKLDMMYYGLFFGIILKLILNIDKNSDDFFGNYKIYLVENYEFIKVITIILIIIFIIYIFYVKRRYIDFNFNFISKHKKNGYVSVEIYDTYNIKIINKYIELFPENIKELFDYSVGDKDLVCDSMYNKDITLTENNGINNIIKKNNRIKIYDTELGFEGFIEWNDYVKKYNSEKTNEKKETTVESKEITLHYPTITILSKNIKSPLNIIQNITDKIKEFEKNKITLWHYKVMLIKKNKKEESNLDNYKEIIYEGPKRDINVREQLYIETFFHKEKDALWSFVKTINYNPEIIEKLGQVPKLNLLLHGPPGSGKSSFAYRIAMGLERHIVSLDLREIDTKSKMYQIFKNPHIEGHDVRSKGVVFILDEFDLGIKYLHKKQRMRELYLNNLEKKIDYNNHLLDNLINNMNSINIKNDFIDKIINQNDFENQEEFKKTKHSKLSTFVDDLINTSKNQNIMEDVDSFVLKDLLEIFQGPIPLNGSIIIATTNDYEEIYKLCPALFRVGRLTPIYFGYADKDILNKISHYYFGKNIDVKIKEELKIPTSQIIEIAVQTITLKNIGSGDEIFKYFESKILELLN